jgi:hypothetical protein
MFLQPESPGHLEVTPFFTLGEDASRPSYATAGSWQDTSYKGDIWPPAADGTRTFEFTYNSATRLAKVNGVMKHVSGMWCTADGQLHLFLGQGGLLTMGSSSTIIITGGGSSSGGGGGGGTTTTSRTTAAPNQISFIRINPITTTSNTQCKVVRCTDLWVLLERWRLPPPPPPVPGGLELEP